MREVKMEDNDSQPDLFILSSSSDGNSLRSQHLMSGHGTLKQEEMLTMHRAPGTIGVGVRCNQRKGEISIF